MNSSDFWATIKRQVSRSREGEHRERLGGAGFPSSGLAANPLAATRFSRISAIRLPQVSPSDAEVALVPQGNLRSLKGTARKRRARQNRRAAGPLSQQESQLVSDLVRSRFFLLHFAGSEDLL